MPTWPGSSRGTAPSRRCPPSPTCVAGGTSTTSRPWTSRFPRSTHVVLLEDLLSDPAALTGLVAALGADPGQLPEQAPEPVNQSSAGSPVLGEDLRGTLEEYYEPGNRALAEMLGRKVPW